MNPLPLADQRHLDAAEGWLGLGNWNDAHEELELIDPAARAHPLVLKVRYQLLASAKQWERSLEIARTLARSLPDDPWGHIQSAYALHELKRTQDAYDVLISVLDKFPQEWLMRYNLACYCCQLGNAKLTMVWLAMAMDLAGKDGIRLMALSDPDLQPLWSQIKEL